MSSTKEQLKNNMNPLLHKVKQKKLATNVNRMVIENNQSIVNNIYLLTVNHKTASVAIREKFAIPECRIEDAYAYLKSLKSFQSFLLLSTCSRTEIYFKTNDLAKAQCDISKFFLEFLNVEKRLMNEYSLLINSNDAVEHAFNVASGIESLIPGERQILSQIKSSYSMSQKFRTLDFTLEKLFQLAIKKSKDIHKYTDISKDCRSTSSIAVDLVDKFYGPIKKKKVMVLGAGRMAKLALERIVKIGGAQKTYVLNRSPHRTIEFTEKYKIDQSFSFSNIYEVLDDVDIVICAAGAPHSIIFPSMYKSKRKDINKKLIIFDISMPRNVDCEFRTLDNVDLIDIDTVQTMYSNLFNTKSEYIDKAKEIISKGVSDFYKSLEKDSSSLIKALKQKTEHVRRQKVDNLTGKKELFTREEVEYITKNILNTLLHEPITNLKNPCTGDLKLSKIRLLKELFNF